MVTICLNLLIQKPRDSTNGVRFHEYVRLRQLLFDLKLELLVHPKKIFNVKQFRIGIY